MSKVKVGNNSKTWAIQVNFRLMTEPCCQDLSDQPESCLSESSSETPPSATFARTNSPGQVKRQPVALTEEVNLTIKDFISTNKIRYGF